MTISYTCTTTGADPEFQVREGALKKIAQRGRRCEKFWGISCEKSRFYPKKIIFFPILGGARAGCASHPESAPVQVVYISGWDWGLFITFTCCNICF